MAHAHQHFGADDVNGTLEDERIQHLSGAAKIGRAHV